ncbi:Mrp family chromosome partitioning ATPase [Ruminiclostridium sufflavum DSM 19573]|uniref:Iron-sulfur cluster carrier protein n=1 Tax=Ruminiclostridium sufflavum DSM 19573 TaxID=1121337 RepID=A0A318XR79_9FIRM|nr:P-loop NTPase [Ruminiclostridium sufflavum]PYG89926.1 Mrp family chromosome partitioning ATPase [Ruminiclostridium sufflavum DSM 19573]
MSDEVCSCGGTNCESESCGGSCSSGGCGNEPQSFIEKTHELNSIKRVIGVVSGKGGVGKSLVTSTLAVMMNRRGYNVGVLDADITGPSIPKVFGINDRIQGSDLGMYPQKSAEGISVMSVNLLLDKDESPVIWRGPVIAGVVKQFWTDVIWGDIDYLFLDMPPGTGDVPLTVFQSIPLDGIIIVSSPQDLVSMIVKKAYNMAKAMNIPVLGIVENMSYLRCPDCGKNIKIFGESKVDSIAEKLGIKVLGKMPIDPSVAELCDRGEVEKLNNDYLAEAVSTIEKKLDVGKVIKTLKIAIPTDGTNISLHFGKCEDFTVFDIENSVIKSKTMLSTEGNLHGLLPTFLSVKGINAVIADSMGDGAKNNLIKNNIEIISGVSGDIDQAINAYLEGTLQAAGTKSAEHEN